MRTTQLNRIFTESDITQLIELFLQGIPVSEIAQMMERPHNNVRNKIRALQNKGRLPKRATSTTLSQDFLEGTAELHAVPLDIVASLAAQTSGSIETRKQRLIESCQAWTAQAGCCYYSPQIVLTSGVHPASATVMAGDSGSIILVCRAIARMRGGMSHKGFINVCRTISQHRYT